MEDLEEKLKRREVDHGLILFGNKLDALDAKNKTIPDHLRKISPQKRFETNCKLVRKNQIKLIEKNKRVYENTRPRIEEFFVKLEEWEKALEPIPEAIIVEKPVPKKTGFRRKVKMMNTVAMFLGNTPYFIFKRICPLLLVFKILNKKFSLLATLNIIYIEF